MSKNDNEIGFCEHRDNKNCLLSSDVCSVKDCPLSRNKKLYGFYSAKAAALYGYASYRTPDGKKIQCTCVDKTPDCPSYMWDDKICLGEVVEWVASSSHKTEKYV